MLLNSANATSAFAVDASNETNTKETNDSAPKAKPPKVEPRGVIDVTGIAPPVQTTPNEFLSRGARLATIRVLEDANLHVRGGSPAYFIRYTESGMLETFSCPSSSIFAYAHPHSSVDGVMSIGECPQNKFLNKNLGAQQTKGFEAALMAVGLDRSRFRKEFGDNTIEALKPEIIQENGTVYIHLLQLLIGGVGGAGDSGIVGVESLLMIPADGSTAIFIQGFPPDNCSVEEPACGNFRSTMREISRQVLAARNNPNPPPNFTLKPLHPDRPSWCDSIAYAVAHALEQSDWKKVPITETLSYRLYSDQTDVLEYMQKAANSHAQGEDISTAAMRIGKECDSPSVKNKE
jgi:hypothetical protein